MRALLPHTEGRVAVDGVHAAYEVFGAGDPTVVFIHGFPIAHSGMWKVQVPYLARRCRVVAVDLPGNGRADRPIDPAAYSFPQTVRLVEAVLDTTGSDRAVLVGCSGGNIVVTLVAAWHPERVAGIVLIAGGLIMGPPPDGWDGADFTLVNADIPDPVGWERLSRRYVVEHYEDFARFFMDEVFNEPHSEWAATRALEQARETTPEVLDAVLDGYAVEDPGILSTIGSQMRSLCARVTCPALVIHGTCDRTAPTEWAEATAAALRADFAVCEGSGHGVSARDPVRVNLLLRQFVDRVSPPPPRRRTWVRSRNRPRRALYISSPIGLGHARRDVAIAQELRALHPDLDIQWLTQHPVTEMLERAGEHVHPASAHLASEASHVESESGEHDLNALRAFVTADEILTANFMLFHDLMEEEQFDLVIGDEAWDVDLFWHENPELKRAAFAWLTDFVGFLPMPEGGEAEARLAADINGAMVDQVARFPRLRDQAVFVGEPEDPVDVPLGPGLPTVRQWTHEHFRFAGHVTGFPTISAEKREEIRADLGWAHDEQVCVVTVGGTSVGGHLLRRMVDAHPLARELVPGLRTVVVAGPRIDPDAIPRRPGLEVHAFVPNLYRHLAACDVAAVQGGLTTCMELTANRRPFLYFPLRRHFEQNIHVRQRLDRYRAGRPMSYEDSPPEVIAAALAAELSRPVDYLEVRSDGAARAASLIAELL